LFSAHFLTTFHIRLNTPHLTIAHISWCQCGHTIDDLGIHLLHCSCWNERTIAQDTLWDIVATIVLENGTHVHKKVSHLFPCHTWRRVDIVVTIDNFQTFANVVITNLNHINLV
jgi:hypothetical protein